MNSGSQKIKFSLEHNTHYMSIQYTPYAQWDPAAGYEMLHWLPYVQLSTARLTHHYFVSRGSCVLGGAPPYGCCGGAAA